MEAVDADPVRHDYNLTEITRLLLKMRDNCAQKEGDAYNDPERQAKYEALQAAVDLINNPSRLAYAKLVRCKDCAHARALPENRKPYFADDIMVCALGRGDPSKGQSVVWPDDFCSDGLKMDGDADG